MRCEHEIAAAFQARASEGDWVRRADLALYRAGREGRNITRDDMDATPAELDDESVSVSDP
ncbi:hypothetical protein [Lysobacter tyrosinilyticus]